MSLIRSIDEALSFPNALRILGVRSAALLFEYAGVPSAIVQAPGAIHRSSLTAFGDYRNVTDGFRPATADDYIRLAEAVDRVATRWSDTVAADYDRSTAVALESWIRRQFLDRDEFNRWHAWSMILGNLSKSPSRLSSASLALEPELRNALTARAIAFDAWGQELRRATEGAERLDVGHDERQLLDLEVSQKGDRPEFDLVEWLTLAAYNDQAYRLISDLSSRLSGSGWREMIRWVTGNLPEIGMPTTLQMDQIATAPRPFQS